MPEKDRIAVVTGANRGIGLEIVRQLARKGLKVYLTARDPGKGERAKKSLEEEGLKVAFHPLDVTDGESIRRLADTLQSEEGVVDVLVNNAGVFLDDNRSSLNVPMATVRKTIETNLYGPLRVSQALVGLLSKSRDGRIINLSSGLGQLSDAGGGYPSYSLSKAALNMLTVKLAADLASRNIKVNTVNPGWVRTDMGGPGAPRSVEEGADTPVWLATASRIPNGKFILDRKPVEW
jgi:NAD(P)-dependent dehydrogenase (short-subunit alcohol dehydrogenase family)